ncbi:NAD(P)H-hydrate epimerase [Aeromonas sp. BIGb0405]|uniref:NAD(P)H-hydrate dehydratase n=1 Tax=Aeromonas sp. BIGb0405 TaxID=2940592 RepID=UPI002168AA3B|nr:NAD(P)H-hydrate dehydratase [Aeromonas sp. BIGb0405]MCS3454902.1 NAD(P)H-hydrate epimerase [Aeromonas sp. BIGb0405]
MMQINREGGGSLPQLLNEPRSHGPRLPSALWRSEQIRRAEAELAAAAGVSLYELMERAGTALFDYAKGHWPAAHHWWIFTGPGNNGGDGYVLARLAQAAGFRVRVIAARAPAQLKGDAHRAAAAFLAAGGQVERFEDVHLTLAEPVFLPDLLIDALLGSGVRLPLTPAMTKIVATINRLPVPLLAVDLPSGLDADTGHIMASPVRATRTLCLVGLKQGLLTGQGPSWCGELDVDPLGLDLSHWQAPAARRIDYPALAHLLVPRARCAHKGEQGRVLLIGGNQGMAGAILLAAMACLRTGAGLVKVCQHPMNVPASQTQPEIMTLARDALVGSSSAAETLPGERLRVGGVNPWGSVRVLGPGLGLDAWGGALFKQALCRELPLVLDADGLNWLALQPRHQDNWVLTPHPAEAARLLGCSTAEVEADRFAAVQTLQGTYGGVVLLKGAGTLIADGKQVWLCHEGNPGMASGGMGDLLSGIIAALLAQGLGARDATCLGAVLHGEAADLAATEGERGMLASDLLPWIRFLANPDTPDKLRRRWQNS